MKERIGRTGKGPRTRASSGFVKIVKNTVTNSVTSSAKAGGEGWEVEGDGEEKEAAHWRTDGLLTAQLSGRRVAQVSSQSVVSGQPRTTTINGAVRCWVMLIWKMLRRSRQVLDLLGCSEDWGSES